VVSCLILMNLLSDILTDMVKLENNEISRVECSVLIWVCSVV